MLETTIETKMAWKNAEPATTRVLINGSEVNAGDIYEKSIKIKESVCDEDALFFVGCIPSYCEVKIRGVDRFIVGKELEIFARAGNTEELPLFKGIIDTVNQDAKKEWASVEAYDGLYELKNKNVSAWYNSLTFPLTLKAFRDSFFAYCGVTQKEDGLANDDVLVEQTIGGEDITGADIIENICQINGVFGFMNRSGVFEYRGLTYKYSEYGTVIDSAEIRGLSYEDFTTRSVTKLQIREDSEDVGAIIGTGDNAYIIEGNFIAYGKNPSELQEMASRLYFQMNNQRLNYTPTTAKINGEPFLEPGDHISVVKANGERISTCILARTLSGSTAYTDELEAQGVENYAEALTSANDSLIQLRGQSNRLVRTVNGLTSTVTTIKENYASKSELQQTSDKITAQIEFLQTEIDGELNMYYIKEAPTLTNYPAWDFTYNIPCNDTVKVADDLQFIYNDEYYRRNIRSLAFDEISLASYRFVQINGQWGWQQVADTEYGVVMKKITTLELTADEIKGSVKQISEDYATKRELEGSISVSADSILQTVRANYTDKDTTQRLESQLAIQIDEISAKVSSRGGNDRSFGWSLTTDAFRLMCNNSEKFRCDQNGVKVNGEIISTSGNIGGWRITSASIDNGIPYTGEKNNNATGIGGYGGGWAFWAGNGKFAVKQDGSMYAENAYISGYATARDIEAVNGKFSKLDANNITTGTLNVARLNITDIMLNMAGKQLGVSDLTTGSAYILNALSMRYNARQIQVYPDATGFMKWRYS